MMTTSTYNPCLIITTIKNKFSIVDMQTDDTLILADEQFSALEEAELKEANFLAKPIEKLTPAEPLIFNSCILTQEEDDKIMLRQKEQGKKIKTVNANLLTYQQSYIKQQACRAYIASICQPEAVFDMSVAAQHQQLIKEDVIALNKHLI